jgi:hypothetical protein
MLRLLLLLALAIPAYARDAAQVRAFRKMEPCPATGKRSGPCPGYHVDHVEPLCALGLDHPANLQWLSVEEHKGKTRTDVRACRELKKPAKAE